MRILLIAAAVLLVMPAAAQACNAKAVSVEEYAAAKKKPVKVVKKTRKPKVEYMRIAP